MPQHDPIEIKCEDLKALLDCLRQDAACRELAAPLQRLAGLLNETGSIVVRAVPGEPGAKA